MKNKKIVKNDLSPNDGILKFMDHHSRIWTFPMSNVGAFMVDAVGNDMAEIRMFPKYGVTISFLADKADALVQIDRWKEYCQK
jgi:hypothetical protein